MLSFSRFLKEMISRFSSPVKNLRRLPLMPLLWQVVTDPIFWPSHFPNIKNFGRHHLLMASVREFYIIFRKILS